MEHVEQVVRQLHPPASGPAVLHRAGWPLNAARGRLPHAVARHRCVGTSAGREDHGHPPPQEQRGAEKGPQH
eukprot:2648352-Alexandrium_andersonii.AAC.1